MIRTLLMLTDPAGAILGQDGTVLLGSSGKHGRTCPISAENKIVGWVRARSGADVAAAALSALCEQETALRALARETLERYAEIVMAYDLAEQVGACLQPSEVSRLIIEVVHRDISSDRVSILLMNKETGLLEVLAASPESSKTDSLLMKSGQGIAGSVYKRGFPEVINDTRADARFISGRQRISSLICAPLKVKDSVIGVVNVSSKEPREYTSGEMKLLGMIAVLAAGALESARLYEELQAKTHSINEAYAALKVLLQKRDEDRRRLEENMLVNIKELVLPYMKKLMACCTDGDQKHYAAIVAAGIKDITSPFARALSAGTFDFTRSEKLVATHIRAGMSTPRIAEAMGVTRRTVEFHRRNIRKKLGIQHTKTNLKAFLASLT
jgi:DNA-binding CsgD family transcriptional regulator/putative methionine-R-sulfoxide reductase with GAF domain